MDHSHFTEGQKVELKKLVSEAITEYFEQKTSTTKQFLIATATVVGSVMVIMAAAKTFLAWFGIGLIGKP